MARTTSRCDIENGRSSRCTRRPGARAKKPMREQGGYRDEYDFALLTELPDHYGEPCDSNFDPCQTVDDCPECPSTGWLVLTRPLR